MWTLLKWTLHFKAHLYFLSITLNSALFLRSLSLVALVKKIMEKNIPFTAEFFWWDKIPTGVGACVHTIHAETVTEVSDLAIGGRSNRAMCERVFLCLHSRTHVRVWAYLCIYTYCMWPHCVVYHQIQVLTCSLNSRSVFKVTGLKFVFQQAALKHSFKHRNTHKVFPMYIHLIDYISDIQLAPVGWLTCETANYKWQGNQLNT